MTDKLGKLPGKTEFAGRRRAVTRTSGFQSHPDTTGGEYKVLACKTYSLPKSGLKVHYFIDKPVLGKLYAFGGWFTASNKVTIGIQTSIPVKLTQTTPITPDWSKFGSMWVSEVEKDFVAIVTFEGPVGEKVSLYGLDCGLVEHKHLEWANLNNPILLKNMYQFSPEAHFFAKFGRVALSIAPLSNETTSLYLKSCNRCARYLPINTVNERAQLSFSNHCVAAHRTPCKHNGFGKLHSEKGEILQLNFGYQLECRYCKKFEVNAAHNPQRSAAQMKEDGARRRALELLLDNLYQGSPQLRYRHAKGTELTDDIWKKFQGRCFNCGIKLDAIKSMHLDHTRPLALLWPIDGTATCLCGSCNSQKRDRSPAEFYSIEKLEQLAQITGIPFAELQEPTPNIEAIKLLLGRLDWLFNTFCQKPELNKVRDGKKASDLLIKALQKVLSFCPPSLQTNLKKKQEELSSL